MAAAFVGLCPGRLGRRGNTGILFRSLSVLLNIAMLYLVFMLVFTLGLPRRFKRAQYRTGALISAVGLTALQLGGAALFAHTAGVSPLAIVQFCYHADYASLDLFAG